MRSFSVSSRQLYFNLVYEYIDQDRPFIGTSRAKVGELRREHDGVSTRNNTYKFMLDYGVTPRFTLGVMLPRLDRLHRHVEHRERTVFQYRRGLSALSQV